MSVKKYNVGIVGIGFIGKVHAYGYNNIPLFYDPLPFDTNITHVCASRGETAEKGRRQVGADIATTDYREITENPDIDIVNICSPNCFHLEQLLSAMKHGKHIYCDKPLVCDMDEALQIREAAKDYSGTLQMTMQMRFFPATIRMRQLIEEGTLGDIFQFRCAFLHAGSADPNAPLKWKLSARHGGGVIADLASHALDFTHYLLGDYDQLSAKCQIAYPERPSTDDPKKKLPVEVEDNVIMLTSLKNGALGTIEATKLATGAEDELRFEVHGSKGALRFNSMDPHHLEYFDAEASGAPIGGRRGWTKIDTGQRYESPAGFPGPKMSIGWIRCHMACLYNFMDSVINERPGNPGLEQGIYIQNIMDKVRESAKNGQWTQID